MTLDEFDALVKEKANNKPLDDHIQRLYYQISTEIELKNRPESDLSDFINHCTHRGMHFFTMYDFQDEYIGDLDYDIHPMAEFAMDLEEALDIHEKRQKRKRYKVP